MLYAMTILRFEKQRERGGNAPWRKIFFNDRRGKVSGVDAVEIQLAQAKPEKCVIGDQNARNGYAAKRLAAKLQLDIPLPQEWHSTCQTCEFLRWQIKNRLEYRTETKSDPSPLYATSYQQTNSLKRLARLQIVQLNGLQMPPLPQYRERRESSAKKARGRRLAVYVALFLVLSWAAYMLLGRTDNMESSGAGGTNDSGKGEDAFGLNARPAFTDMIQLMDLPPDLLPETGKHRHGGRLVIVGDVHGMKEALVDLLDKVDFDKKHDHLILAGDMVSKGPDSPGVVDLAMKLGATGIRGNHEDRIILTYDDMVADHLSMDAPGPSEERDKSQDALEEVSFNHGDYKDRALVRALGEKRIKWLKKCPVILRVGKLGSLGEVAVVHAGLAPNVELERQDPFMVMNMRTIKDGVPSEDGEGMGWMKVRLLISS